MLLSSGGNGVVMKVAWPVGSETLGKPFIVFEQLAAVLIAREAV